MWLSIGQKGLNMESALSAAPVERLIRLRDLCDSLLREAAMSKSRFKGDAINWGDLRVIDAEWCVSVDASERFVVTISEAAPDASGLQGWLISRVAECGFGDCCVSFVMEW